MLKKRSAMKGAQRMLAVDLEAELIPGSGIRRYRATIGFRAACRLNSTLADIPRHKPTRMRARKACLLHQCASQ
jgi:hypothetical protein